MSCVVNAFTAYMRARYTASGGHDVRYRFAYSSAACAPFTMAAQPFLVRDSARSTFNTASNKACARHATNISWKGPTLERSSRAFTIVRTLSAMSRSGDRSRGNMKKSSLGFLRNAFRLVASRSVQKQSWRSTWC